MTGNRRTARRIRDVLLVTVLVAIGPIASATAAEKAIWGPAQLPDGHSAFGLYDQLGIDTIQVTIDWSQAAPTRPASPQDPADAAYHWPADVTATVAEAARHRMQVALLITAAPPWSNGGRPSIWAPERPQDFADFLTAAARRYPAVRRWMIWGEPNKDDRFQPNRGPHDPIAARTYAPLLDAAYGALKRQSPANRVIGGMTWTGGTIKPPDFVRWMRLPNGRPPRLDWFGHNPFPFRFPDLANPPNGGFRDISDLDTFGREVDRAYGRTERHAIPLWLSEYSIQSDRASRVFATFVSEPNQARYVTAGYRIADDLGDRVAGLGWHRLLDEQVTADSANWGLLTYALRRKPAFDALARAPSLRASPALTAASHIRRRALRSPGIAVTLTPRRRGRITVELRRAGLAEARVAVLGRTGVRRTIRVRASVARGRLCTIVVRSARGATVRRPVRVG